MQLFNTLSTTFGDKFFQKIKIINYFIILITINILFIKNTAHALVSEKTINQKHYQDRHKKVDLFSFDILNSQEYISRNTLISINFGFIGATQEQENHDFNHRCLSYACMNLGIHIKFDLP